MKYHSCLSIESVSRLTSHVSRLTSHVTGIPVVKLCLALFTCLLFQAQTAQAQDGSWDPETCSDPNCNAQWLTKQVFIYPTTYQWVPPQCLGSGYCFIVVDIRYRKCGDICDIIMDGVDLPEDCVDYSVQHCFGNNQAAFDAWMKTAMEGVINSNPCNIGLMQRLTGASCFTYHHIDPPSGGGAGPIGRYRWCSDKCCTGTYELQGTQWVLVSSITNVCTNTACPIGGCVGFPVVIGQAHAQDPPQGNRTATPPVISDKK